MLSKVIVKETSIGELEQCQNIYDLLAEYANESSIDGLPTPNAKAQIYLEIEKTGALHSIGAFCDTLLIGFIVILTPVLPHYGIMVSVVDSFFVANKYRNTGAGLKLLRAAEKYSKERMSPGLLISAPIDGALDKVLSTSKYTLTNRVFFRKF